MMRTVKLESVKCKAPFCSDYEDEAKVLAFERQMRVYRAHMGAFLIQLPPGVPLGTYRVSSERGRDYWVDILDGSGRRDTCNCPDYLHNGIRTCKHLEAVRRYLDQEKELAALLGECHGTPGEPVVSLGVEGFPCLVGVVDPATLAHWGLSLQGDALEVRGEKRWPRWEALEDAGVRVTHGARAWLAQEGMRFDERIRRHAFQRALEQGRAGVDVLKLALFPYQQTGVKHLATKGRALLADDMGLGKTVQAIAACEVLRQRGEARTIFIVTPASLKEQWASEIRRYTGEEAVVLSGRAAQRSEALMGDAPYKILNYELTWRELSRLQDLEPDVLVLDEAQRAKNFRTRTADTLRAIPSRFLFVLTGTPIENRLDDLYSLMQLVDPQVLGPLWRFNLEFHQQNEKGRVQGTKNMSALRQRLAPYVLRRRKEEVLDQLPSITIQTRYTPLTPSQRVAEEGCRMDAAVYLSILDRRPLTLEEQQKLNACLLKARQACNALELYDPRSEEKASPKLDEFEALISEITSVGNHKVLVFSEWVEMLHLAADRLDRQKIGWTMLSGRVPTEKRGALLDHFRQDPDIQVLLCSDAGGSGLNLQVANYVIHLDLPWNPARLDQRNARAHRLGQTRGVNVIQLCAASGIERGIEGALDSKRALRAAALDLDSEAEEVESQGFHVFLRQLNQVLLASEESPTPFTQEGSYLDEARGEDAIECGLPEDDSLDVIAAGPVVAPPCSGLELASGDLCTRHESDTEEAADAASFEPPEETVPPVVHGRPLDHTKRALDRLRLAKVVLEAGFPTDALRAAYEALCASIVARLDDPPEPGHGPLVAAIYRELLPSGRLPVAVPATLARLHDLTSLEQHGVEPDVELVRHCVEEAESWVERLAMAEEA